jgi:phage baseplate assembly protein W
MSLQQIIGVKRGEMFMQRKFGSGVRGLIFQMDTLNLQQRIEFAVTRAINERQFGEKRVFINQMAVTVERSRAVATIILNVVLRSSNVEGNLVLPFYTSEADRDSVNQILSE